MGWGALHNPMPNLSHRDLAEQRTESRARVLRDWLADPELLVPPQIIIPYCAVEGRVTLLSGREKIGKSTLAGCVVASASRGDAVLGLPLPEPTGSLWYALDEPVADTVRRFDRLSANTNRIVINDEPRTADDLLRALTADLSRFAVGVGIELVVVDNLSRILAMSGVDPNSSREVEPILAEIVTFFQSRNLAAILLYHTGKNGREYRGTTAIGATVDEVLTLRKRIREDEDDFDNDATDDGRRLLVQDGRNLRGRVHLTCVNGVYGPYEQSGSDRTRILDALRDHGTIRGRGELCRTAGIRRETGLKMITLLIDEGAIIENGSNLRASPVLRSTGSAQFPERGTGQELRQEPRSPAPDSRGSDSRNPLLPDTGTQPSGRFYLSPEEERIFLEQQAELGGQAVEGTD